MRTWVTRRPKNYDGRTYPSGVVIVRELQRENTKRRSFECKCPCGRLFKSGLANLTRQKSCGCARKLEDGVAAFRHVYNGYARSASDRGHEWCISIDEFRAITQMNCTYCGVKPSTLGGLKNDRKVPSTGLYVYNGLDRVDTSAGYTMQNIVPCCWFCNRAKNSMSSAEWIEWSNRFSEFQISKRVK
jgi:hypothetical protein